MLESSLVRDGNIVLLGCFTGAKQYGGDIYLQKWANYTHKTVYGNQGEGYLGNKIFSNKPIGGTWDGKDEHLTFKDVAIENAGKWRMAQYNMPATISINNLSINGKGSLSFTNRLFGGGSINAKK